MKTQLSLCRLLVVVTSMLLAACGAPATTVVTETQPPNMTEIPTGSVAILVLDDFVDELANSDNSPAKYKKILDSKGLKIEEINPTKNCIVTMQGQAAIAGKGAAAIAGKGADGSPIPLPAPHGNITYAELYSVIKRVNDPITNQLANTETQSTNGLTEFGLDWIKAVNYFTNIATKKSIALVAVDTSDYTTDVITDHLDAAIRALEPRGFSRFVVNMSFVIMPCPDFAEAQPTFDSYQEFLNEDSHASDLQDSIRSSTAENGDITFSDKDGNIILTRLATKDQNGNQFNDRDGSSINDQDAALILGLDPNLGPLRLRAYYTLSEYNTDKFETTYKQVLDDPIRDKIFKEQAAVAIPVAAAGNDGLPYPYAPAMWNEVLSVSSPIKKDKEGFQVSPFVDNSGNTSSFRANSGETQEEGCTNYVDANGSHRIPGTSFATPKVSYLAALYLLQDNPLSCMGTTPIPPLGYAEEDGNWKNLSIQDAANQFCRAFPANVDVQKSCP